MKQETNKLELNPHTVNFLVWLCNGPGAIAARFLLAKSWSEITNDDLYFMLELLASYNVTKDVGEDLHQEFYETRNIHFNSKTMRYEDSLGNPALSTSRRK